MSDYIVKSLCPGVWKVISPKGALYFVWLENSGLKCTCPYFTYRKGKLECKHIKLVKEVYSI